MIAVLLFILGFWIGTAAMWLKLEWHLGCAASGMTFRRRVWRAVTYLPWWIVSLWRA